MIKSQPFEQFLKHDTSYPITFDLANLVVHERNLTRINFEKYVWAVDAIVLNLFTAYLEDANKTVGISRDKNFWDGKDKFYGNPKLSFTAMVTSLDALKKHGYIDEVLKGKQAYLGWHGITTRYKATEKLIKLFKEYTWNEQQVYVSPEFPSIRLRGKKPKRTVMHPFPKGKLIEFEDNDRIQLMRKVLDLINENLKDTDINLYISKEEEKELNRRMANDAKDEEELDSSVRYHKKYLYRVFNQDFEHGGRFYGGFWQQIPSEFRSRLTIDGFHTFEMDYSSIHFAMLYHKEGYKKEDFKDPYTLYIEDEQLRKVIKTTMNIMLNTSSFDEALVVCRHHEMKLPKGTYKTWKALLEDIIEHHKPIKKYFFKQLGTELQKLDSDIAEYLITTMINKHGVLVLPIHDSFVCPIKDLEVLIDVMHEAAKKVAGLSLYLEPKVSKKNYKGFGGKTFKINESDYYQRRKDFLRTIGLYYLNEPPNFV